VVESDAEAKAYTLDAEMIKIQLNDTKVAELTREILDSLEHNIQSAEAILPMSESEISDYMDITASSLEQDVSCSNKEVSLEDLGDISVISFKFEHSKYLEMLELLDNAKGKLELDTQEQVLYTLL